MRFKSSLIPCFFSFVLAVDALRRSIVSGGPFADVKCQSASAHPTLTLVSVVVGLKESYTDAIRENRAAVSNAYGYEHCYVVNVTGFSRHLQWTKVKAIQELLRQGRQTIVWIDADAYFTRLVAFDKIFQWHHKAKQVVFDFFQKKDIIFTDDNPFGDPCGINTGVIAMKNSPWTGHFWEEVWNNGPGVIAAHGGTLNDQAGVCIWREDNRQEFHEHAQIINRKAMNDVGELWHADFIAHAAGGSRGGKKYDQLLSVVKMFNRKLAKSNALATSRAATYVYEVDFTISYY